MEEDIKVLEELCNNFRFEQRQILTDGDYTEFIDIQQIQAIENIIKEYKELEEENFNLKEKLKIVDIMCLVEKDKYEIIRKKDYIEKSKVREKIDILNTNIVNAERFDRDYIGNCRFAKYILQELLQEGDTNATKM